MYTAKEFTPVPPQEAFKRLKDGNKRFVDNVRSINAFATQNAREHLASTTQRPFAIILCCSDSRAPAEIIFDQGIGDLFVVRVAGNIVAPSLIGSIEFAASTFGSQLVVVMGHTACGAVAASVDAVKKGSHAPTENIQDIIQRIIPQIEGIVRENAPHDKTMHDATRANINMSVSQLKHGSKALESMVLQGKLKIIGAEYNLASGKVEFFEEI